MILPTYSPPSTWALAVVLEAAFNDIGCYEYDSMGHKYQSWIRMEEFNSLIFDFNQKALKKDMNNTDYYNPYKAEDNYLYSIGIIDDVNKTFAKPVTRQEAAVILVGSLKAAGINVSINNPHHFKDDQQISNWAKESLTFCYERGIMHQTGNNKIGPLEPLTYEQAIALIHRAGTMYGILKQAPTFRNTEIITAESLPSVNTRSELAKYFNKDKTGLLSGFPSSIYKVDNFNKAIYIDESKSKDKYAPTYDQLQDLCNQTKKWSVIYDISYDPDKHCLYSFQRGNNNNAVSRVWFFMKDGNCEYAVHPFSFKYIGASYLHLGYTSPLNLISGHTNKMELIPLGGAEIGTFPYYKDFQYENIEYLVVQYWDNTYLLIRPSNS